MTEAGRPDPSADTRLDAACAPREEVAGRSPWRLYRYSDGCPDGPPIVIVYSLINRPTLLDLDPGHSLVRRLIEQGRDVYLLAWDDPAPWQRLLGLDDYALRFPRQALTALNAYRGDVPVDMLGVCQGGFLALCHAIARPAAIRRLVLMATPVDTSRGDHRLGRLLRMAYDTQPQRNVPGETLSAVFASLRLTDLLVRRYRRGGGEPADAVAQRRFRRMEEWMYDCPDQPARLVREMVTWHYLENRLANGRLELDGTPIRPGELQVPVLNVAARHDHLVPPESALALSGLLPAGQVTSRLEPGGHLGLFVSRRAQRDLMPALGEWLDTAPE